MLEHHPDRPLADLRWVSAWSCHRSILSRTGASNIPGAVQIESEATHVVHDAGGERLSLVHAVGSTLHFSEHSYRHRKVPEVSVVEDCARSHGRNDARGQRRGTDSVEPKQHYRIAHGRNAAGKAVIRGIRKPQNLRRQRLIARDGLNKGAGRALLVAAGRNGRDGAVGRALRRGLVASRVCPERWGSGVDTALP